MGQCRFDRPLLGEYYSHENGLETHTSFQPNGDIYRRFYQRESGAGATRTNRAIHLVNNHTGQCFQLTIKQQFYQLIYRDK